MERIMKQFHLDPCYPTDTEMARAIKRLLEPYNGDYMGQVFIAESMRDAKLDGMNPKVDGYVELATGEVVWIKF
jgi:hypothetical protein